MGDSISRRTFLKLGAASGSTIFLGMIVATEKATVAQANTEGEAAVRLVAPSEASVLPGFLAAKLEWAYADEKSPHGIILSVTSQHDARHPVINLSLDGAATTYALALLPTETYRWQLQPVDEQERPIGSPARGVFRMGAIRLVQDPPPDEEFSPVRKGAHNLYYKPAVPFVEEPLSPWYDVKKYSMAPPPKFDDVRDHLPGPVFDGHPEALEIYWHCWKVFFSDKRTYAPAGPNHQAVANICGIWDWGDWGSSMVEDQAIMMHFARYGHQAYPFITCFDNVYARQHENGFICQEADNHNQEVYALFPAQCIYLIGRAEWDYYLVSGDAARLRRVFMPLVKNYEWFMTYMRHTDGGIYGFDTPGRRNEYVEIGPECLAFTATTLRAAETLAMSRIATVVGRPDMARFFAAEYRRLSDYINQHFWDAEYQLYNDRCGPNNLWKKYRAPELAGKFVTQPTPGDINKPVYTFTALFAEIAPPERVRALQRLAQDSQHGFAWPTGVGYYSRDSALQGMEHDASYFGPTKHNINVWAPPQYFFQEGFKLAGKRAVAQQAAERYFTALVTAYKGDKYVGELMDPNEPIQRGMHDFVGWSGLGPISSFIEYILGFDINVPQKTIVWHLQRTERHGLRHLKVGEFYVDLLCEERATADAPCQVTVTSGGVFTLKTALGGKVLSHRIEAGRSTLRIG